MAKNREPTISFYTATQNSDLLRRRVTFTQLEILWEILHKNRELALGFNKTAQAREYSKRMWIEIADQLNSLGDGATKDWKSWCKYWNDYKSKLKKMVVTARTAHEQTGGGPSGVKPITGIEQKFLDFLGPSFGLPGKRVEPFEQQILTPEIKSPSASDSEEGSLSTLQTLPAVQPSAEESGPSWRVFRQTSTVANSPSPPAATPPLSAQNTTRPSTRRRRLRRVPLMFQDAESRALITLMKEKAAIARHRNGLLGALVEELREIKEILRSR